MSTIYADDIIYFGIGAVFFVIAIIALWELDKIRRK